MYAVKVKNMKLSQKEIEHIAILARLGLKNDEKERFSSQLSSILDYVEILNEVNTDEVEITAQVTGLENVMREDEVEEVGLEVKKGLIEQSPASEDNLVKTKSVF